MAAAAAAASSRRRRQHRPVVGDHHRRQKRKHNYHNGARRRRLAGISHLNREQGRNSIVTFANKLANNDGLAIINEARVLHNYTASYDQYDTLLNRVILPPDYANFAFLPYRIDSKKWADGAVETMPSPFGEIKVKYAVKYPTTFLRVLPKASFQKLMTSLHDNIQQFNQEELQRKQSLSCLKKVLCVCNNSTKQFEQDRIEYLETIIEEEVNVLPNFQDRGLTMEYLICGKLEGLVLSISPWLQHRGDLINNQFWEGSRPLKPLSVVESEQHNVTTCTEAVLVPDDTFFGSAVMCDPPVVDTRTMSSIETKSEVPSIYAVKKT